MKKLLFVFLLFVVFGSFFFFKKEKNDFRIATLKGKKTEISYLVEIADTQEKAEIGLMWRKSMPQNQGMLFVFSQARIIKMWMKNTYIPLDMIFFNTQNQVVCLHENAHPLDESIITCPYSSDKVLELNAGEIKSHNIQIGDFLFMK